MAASQGSVPSMIMLANPLLDNSGPALDPSEAAEWFRAVSKSGNLTAQFNLGVLHESGLGVEQDWVKAAKWYDHAANQGHAEAQWNLALLYEQGKGLPQSDAMALKWFERSAEQGLADACLALQPSIWRAILSHKINGRPNTGFKKPSMEGASRRWNP